MVFIGAFLTIIIPSTNVYAPCPQGVTECGPPPGVTVSTSTDNPFYEKNDTINLQGRVYLENYNKSIQIQIVNPENKTIQSFEVPVTNNTFNLKTKANFETTGVYQMVTCLNSWCDRAYFKYIAEPYKLTFNNQNFLIKYKTFADLVGIDVDINNTALRVHIANATSTGQKLILELPRTLIDPKKGNHDASFKVLVGVHQPDKYMQIADFKEIATNDVSRTLAINIPYNPMVNAYGIWDFKITGPEILSGPSFFTAPPLRQFEYGMYAQGVHCVDNLLLILKAEDGSPACVKPQTAQILLERGWAKEIVQESKIQGTSQQEANQTITTSQTIPPCVSNIPNQYAIADGPGFPLCPFASFQASSQIVNSTGFYGIYNYTKFPNTQNFVLEPGHNGTITYLISIGTIHNLTNVPEYPNKVNIPNDVTFMHDAGMHNHPGVDVFAKPLAQIVGSNESVSISFTFSASKSALPGTYWVTFPPGICGGGQMIILTITNCTK